jgi:hypothetical protein
MSSFPTPKFFLGETPALIFFKKNYHFSNFPSHFMSGDIVEIGCGFYREYFNF